MERKSGVITITSSANGIEGGPLFAHYTASKHGVIGLMKTIALEVGGYGIRCNAIAPGAVKTPMTNQPGVRDIIAGKQGATEQDMDEAGYAWFALKGTTLLPPTAIAKAGLYLNSDLAAHVTGVTLPVDGGHLLLPGINPAPVK
jgi:NAD(P)-dependent dehydrogenase (short-subunit alcohol dehydrogenase family)